MPQAARARAIIAVSFATIVATYGRIDVLVNNAGISGGPAATICHETPIEEWDRVHAINSRGPFLCSRAALPVKRWTQRSATRCWYRQKSAPP